MLKGAIGRTDGPFSGKTRDELNLVPVDEPIRTEPGDPELLRQAIREEIRKKVRTFFPRDPVEA